MNERLKKMISLMDSLEEYSPAKLKADLIAGLLVGIMLVPQAMGYAMLAGLPPVVGLYASTLPLVLYAVFGTARHLAVGPVAMISLLVFASCSQLATPGTPEYIQLTIVMAGLSGLILLILGVMRAGFLVNFISDSVIHGFTSAAAIIIATSQIPQILGFKVSGKGIPIAKIVEMIIKIPESHLATVLIGLGCIILLIVFNRVLPRGIGPFSVVFLSTLLVYLTRIDQSGLAIVGTIPQGLPTVAIPVITLEGIKILLPGAFSIAFIGYVESMAVAKLIASKRGYSVNPNRELTALGLSNLVACIFSGYPITGGFSRSAVNNDAGAHTGIASLITALVVILTLLLLTPLFYFMPKATLAAIVIVSVIKLIDIREGFHLYRILKSDGLAFAVTFLTTLGLGVEEGILTGLVFSLAMYLWRSSQPYIAELGYVPEEKIFRDIRYYQDSQRTNSMLFIRVEGPLFFANLKFLETRVESLIHMRKGLSQIVFDLSGVFYIDAVAVRRIEKLISETAHRGIETLFSRTRGEIRKTLLSAGWAEKQLMKRIYTTNIELFRKFQDEIKLD